MSVNTSANTTLSMLCNQCSMSMTGGCGSSGQEIGTCGKDKNLSNLQDMMIYGLKGLSAYRTHADQFGADTKKWMMLLLKLYISHLLIQTLTLMTI